METTLQSWFKTEFIKTARRHRPHRRKRRARSNWEHERLVKIRFITSSETFVKILSDYFAYKRKKEELQKIEQDLKK